MAGEITRELKLRIVCETDQATSASKSYHDAEKRRIKESAAEQAKADAAYERAIRSHIAAEKQLEREKIRGVKAAAKAQADAHREANALLKQITREDEQQSKQATREKLRVAKEAAKEKAAWEKVQHKWTMDAWREEQQALKEQQHSVNDVVKAFMNMQVVKDIAGWVKEAMQVVGQSTADAREHGDRGPPRQGGHRRVHRDHGARGRRRGAGRRGLQAVRPRLGGVCGPVRRRG
jgi:hypothetical protein